MNQNQKLSARWILPLLVGAAIPPFALSVVRALHPPLPPGAERTARSLGMQPEVFTSVFRIYEKLEGGSDIAPSEWALICKTLKDPNPHAQIHALRALSFMKRSRYRDEAILLARPFLQSKFLYAELGALNTLWRLRDPSWRTEVERRAGRQEEAMKSTLQAILARERLKR